MDEREALVDTQRRVIAVEHVTIAALRMLLLDWPEGKRDIVIAALVQLAQVDRKGLWPGSGPMPIEVLEEHNAGVRAHEMRLLSLLSGWEQPQTTA